MCEKEMNEMEACSVSVKEHSGDTVTIDHVCERCAEALEDQEVGDQRRKACIEQRKAEFKELFDND